MYPIFKIPLLQVITVTYINMLQLKEKILRFNNSPFMFKALR